MSRRRIAAALLVLPLALAGAAWSRPSAAEQETVTATTFVITGHGWGHGVGMAQWGALGFARNGMTYDGILAYYYPGTELGQAPVTKLRVLLAERKKVKVASDSDFTVLDGAGTVHELPAGSVTVGKDLSLAVDPTQPPEAMTGPLTFRAGSSPLQLGPRDYRGSIQVQLVGEKLQAVNVVGLEAYLRGVVTEEMPAYWPLEALKAQAVAARSYALAVRQMGAVLFADQRGQVYHGIRGESATGDAAVVATRRQVLLYQGEVATTYYSSSSGGRTAAFTDVFPDAAPIPYLVSVRDPYDMLSPYHSWGPATFRGAQVARLLGVPGVTDLVAKPSTGRARIVVATAAIGTVTLAATAVRRALGLWSTWFRAGVLLLSRQAGTFAPGSEVTVNGIVRRVAGVSLEQRPAGAVGWEPGPAISPGPDGSFSIAVEPTVTTLYRLVAGEVTSTPLRVPVDTTS